MPVFMMFGGHCIKLMTACSPETADCDFKMRYVCESNESALHSAAKQMLFTSC